MERDTGEILVRVASIEPLSVVRGCVFKNKVTIVSSDRKYLPIRALKVAQALNEAGYSAEILAWDRSQNKSTIEVLSGCNVRCFGLKVNDSE